MAGVLEGLQGPHLSFYCAPLAFSALYSMSIIEGEESIASFGGLEGVTRVFHSEIRIIKSFGQDFRVAILQFRSL